MKRLFFIGLCLSATILFVTENVMGMQVLKNEVCSSSGQLQTVSPLEKAFNDIARIPKMEAMPETYLKEMYPAELKATRCVVYGNSEPRETVLKILNRIPKNLLYRDITDEEGKTDRFYIGKNAEGQAEMLYAFVGLGGNDLMVVWFAGASLETYQKAASK